MFENVSEIILKVTRDCNLRCAYCYIKNKDRYQNERMSFETFKKLIDRVAADKQKNIRPHYVSGLQIIFHGGEPTLLSPKTLETFISYAQEKLPVVSFGMQTNMTNIDEHWISFLKKHHIRPGVSIDGWTTEDNSLRSKDLNIKSTLDMLNAAGVGYGPLMVLTKTNIKNFYINTLKIIEHAHVAMIKANYAENTLTPQHTSPEVTPAEMYTYVFLPTMEHFFKMNMCIEENIQHYMRVYVENLLYVMDHTQKKSCRNNCLEKFCGGGNNVVEIDPDGIVCFCGRWADVNDLNTLGSIDTYDPFGLVSMLQGIQVQKQKIKALQKNKCHTCPARSICTYSCAAFAYDKYGEIRIRHDLVCTFTKKILRFFKQHTYKLLIHYVQANHWELRDEQGFYLLNIPAFTEGLAPRQSIADKALSWTTRDDKLYVRLNKKYYRERT